MSDPSPHPLTRVFEASRAGDAVATAELLPLLYDELRQLARSLLARRPPGQTLQPTALVHEAYLRILGAGDAGSADSGSMWDGRGHFFSVAARAMREILVEDARRKAAIKRGGGRKRIPFDAELAGIEPPSENVLALDEALARLEADDSRKGQIVMLRYFAGLSIDETAATLGVSTSTVEREWRYVRAWLYRELATDGQETPARE